MNVETYLLLILVVNNVTRSVIGTRDCCPSLYKITNDNTCKLSEDDLDEEQIRDDYRQICEGRLERISYQDVYLTSFDGQSNGHFYQI